ncbi:MAG TPA: hypothetical protein VGP36_14425 [Mycobacteriales bacterium]|nr:hypothetical protein [Mycobacteriales bacterium]
MHWHRESPVRRAELALAVADLNCDSVVIVGTPVDPRRQDRARRQCLERLLWDLRTRSVGLVRAESRGPERDRADTTALAGFRRKNVMPAGMRFEHGLPAQDRCLWLPDTVAGAILADLRGDSRYRKPLDHSLRVLLVELG